MKGKTIFRGPPDFGSFEIAHRLEGTQHWLEISYGSSFNELYYDFTPHQFFTSEDRPELENQLGRAGASALLPAIKSLALGAEFTTAQLRALLSGSGNAQQGIQLDGPASGGSAS